MDCFWARGYAATSVRDLAQAMGITGASLYNAFGDKRALYRRALDRYVEHGVRARIAQLEATLPPREAISGLLEEVIERSAADPGRRGCMLVNATLETADEGAFRDMVTRELDAIEAFFRRRIEAGQADGSIDDGQTSEALAAMLLSVLLGIRVLARTGCGRARLDAAAFAALASF